MFYDSLKILGREKEMEDEQVFIDGFNEYDRDGTGVITKNNMKDFFRD